MFIIVYLLLGLLVATVVGVFFLGGKRAPKPTSDGFVTQEAANVPSGIGVGATNKKPARTSTGDN